MKLSRSIAALAVIAAHGAGIVGEARADVTDLHPDVARRAAAVRSARGPEAYAALRELWRTWDRADPSQIESALDEASEGSALPASTVVYAKLLAAYARRRRGDFDGALARVEKLGFIGRWAVLGPFDNEHKGGFTAALAPEVDLLDPIVPGHAYDGKERPVRWRVPPEVQTYGWFDFGDIVRPRESMCAYATTFVRAKPGTPAPREVSLWFGSSGASRVYWNGAAVLEDAAYRAIDIDRMAARVTLRPGFNRITVKGCGDDEAPKFALRVADQNGAPDLDIEVSADIEVSRLVAETPHPKGERARAVSKSTIEGPLQILAARAASEGAAPAALEAYARYLTVTGGDPKSEHVARDLARRAAELEPNVSRALLAASLAEDRNQQREWLVKARSLVRDRADDVDVLLAEAELARTGTNWRDAIPIFERVLALEPDNVAAILGRVELYTTAGLKSTALATLEAAVARQPYAILLLRAYAGELRSAGRETEAFEVEARYAALRFDDSGFLGQMVELAVARRDGSGAERWLGRLLHSESDGAWVRGIAAKTYRSLGQQDRARAAYTRALAMAPEDVPTLRALSDLYGEDGDREAQLRLLRQIVALEPQAKDVREYLERIDAPGLRADEAYAWPPERFLAMRSAPDEGYARRTLRNLVVTTVFPNGLASRFHQVVFQPLTEEAAASGREFGFDFHGDREIVQLRAARVYRQNGKIDEAIESGEGAANNPAIAMYTSSRTYYVHFPRLEKGDVVELRYRVEDTSPRNEVGDSFSDIQYLQSDEPMQSSEYVLVAPTSRAMNIFASPIPGLVRETRVEGDRTIRRFAIDKPPPVAPEPAMPPWSEVLAHVQVSTFKTWDEVGSFYWGLAREQFDVDDEVRRTVRAITKGLTDDRAKVSAVYKYATRTRYVALEFGIEGIKPRRSAQTLARGWGDCKDKATLIVTMLRELGIPATIVLVRTKMRGEIETDPPSLGAFDHAIAFIPSLDLYLDGTAENTGTNELPAMDRDAIALVVNEGKPKLVRLPSASADASIARRRAQVTLSPDGAADLLIDTQVSGVFASDFRQRYFAEGTRRERAARDLAADFGSVDIGARGVEVGDVDEVEQPVRLRVRGRTLSFARLEGDTWSLPAGPPQHLLTEYASLSRRRLDVVLPARFAREDEWVIKLPQAAKLVALPTPASEDGPFGSFAVTVESSPGKITIQSRLSFKETHVTPSNYAAWRSFCEAVDRAFGQRIVVGR